MLTLYRDLPRRIVGIVWTLSLLAAAACLGASETPTTLCGFCYAVGADGAPIVVPLESTEVVLDVKPGLIEAEVTQTFTNRTAEALEATYLYPLPHDATITNVELRYADHIVASLVREKKQAQQEYEVARAEGKKAALVTKHDASMFSTSVANFLPGETVRVVFKFIQPTPIRADAVEVRFPMVTGEKYFPADTLPGSPGAAAPTPSKVDAASVASHHVYAFDIAINGIPAKSIESPSHRIRVENQGANAYRVALAEEITIPDRDFVLRIETEASAKPQPTLVTEKTPNGTFGLLTLFPPLKSSVSAHAQNGRDFLFLLDHSGSMQGTRIASARLGLQTSLKTLTPQDRFQIVIFDSAFSFYRNEWLPASGPALDEAIRYVNTIQANSGTEMQPALAASLEFIHAREDARESVIIFLTDGDVGNEASLFNLLENKIGRTRLFAFGIGQEPNTYLLSKMAELGRGQARFISDDNAVARELADLFSTLDAPVLTELKLTLMDRDGSPIRATIYPQRMSDVFAGRPIQAIFSTGDEVPAAATIEAFEDEMPTRIHVPFPNGPVRGEGLEKRFGKLQYEELDSQRRRTTDREPRSKLETEMLNVALRYQLVTEFTSRVAIDRNVSRDAAAALKSTIVPQYRAADQTHGVNVPDDAIELSPFSVDSDSDRGYKGGSTLAGTRLRTTVGEATGASSVITQQFLEDFSVSKLEDVLPFTLEPAYNPSLVRAGTETGLLDGLPVATVIDAATVSRIEFQANGPAWSNVVQRHASQNQLSALTLRAGNERFSSATLQSAFALAGDKTFPGMAILSWSTWGHPQSTALFSAQREVRGNRIEFDTQARDLAGYGQMQFATATLEHKFTDESWLVGTVAWHNLHRENPFQFRRGAPESQYDGLGFFNLDLLTAEVRRIEDLVAQLQFTATSRTGTIEQTWNATMQWHEEKLPWATSITPASIALQHDDLSADLSYQLKTNDGHFLIRAEVGATERQAQNETQTHTSAGRFNLGATWEFASNVHAFASVGRESVLPSVPSGDLTATNDTWTAVSLEAERRTTTQAGLRLETWSGRLSFEAALFDQAVANESLRDWSWERDHSSSGTEVLSDSVLRLPVNYALLADWRRAGCVGSISFSPAPEITATATWDTESETNAPYRGGNRRASLAAKYTFRRGALKDLSLGFGAAMRNALTFDDGYQLKGGTRYDLFVSYRRRWFGHHWTRIQVNGTNLTGTSWQLTRFAPDHGRGVIFTLSQEY